VTTGHKVWGALLNVFLKRKEIQVKAEEKEMK
jgi:hypothetical protein